MVVSIQIVKSYSGTNSSSKSSDFSKLLRDFSLPPKKVAKTCEGQFKHGQLHCTIKGVQRRFQIANSSTAKQNWLSFLGKHTHTQDELSICWLTLLHKHHMQGFRLLEKVTLHSWGGDHSRMPALWSQFLKQLSSLLKYVKQWRTTK